MRKPELDTDYHLSGAECCQRNARGTSAHVVENPKAGEFVLSQDQPQKDNVTNWIKQKYQSVSSKSAPSTCNILSVWRALHQHPTLSRSLLNHILHKFVKYVTNTGCFGSLSTKILQSALNSLLPTLFGKLRTGDLTVTAALSIAQQLLCLKKDICWAK